MLIKKEKIPFKKIITIGLLPSFLKIFYYRLRGYKIAKNVSMSWGSVVIGDKVIIENDSKIGFLTVIRAKSNRIGRFVKIGSMKNVFPFGHLLRNQGHVHYAEHLGILLQILKR